MRDAYIRRRIKEPVLAQKMLIRQNLIEALYDATTENSGYKLILLCAPCGYGKTSLLASFAQQTGFPCCWCSLEHTDTNKIAFLTLLMTSICMRFPQTEKKMNALLADLQSSLEAEVNQGDLVNNISMLIEALTSIIETEIVERFAVIISNYHEVHSNPFIKSLMNQLLLKLPSRCLLFIESRAVPDLELAPLLAHRQVFGMGSSGLRFSPDEIYQLAHLQGMVSFSTEEAKKLAEAFDGWITGILLGTRLGDLEYLHSVIPINATWGAPAMRMGRQHLFAYLVKEVFSHEKGIYSFVQECSILQQMAPVICNGLLHISDALVRLTYLEQQGLFVTHSGESSQIIFTCHPMLRELLCEELRVQAPERFYALHYQAAELFYETSDYDQAIYHACCSNNEEFKAKLIEEACRRIPNEGFFGTVPRWISELPAELLSTYPGLLLINANIYLAAGEYINARPLLEKAAALIEAKNLPITMDIEEIHLLEAKISLAHSKAFFLEEDYTHAQIFCQNTLSLLSADEVALRADAHLRLGMCAVRQGDFIMGIMEFQQALQFRGRHAQGNQIARLYSQLANAYHMIGNDALSEHYRTRSLSCWNQLHDETGKVNNLIAMGVVLQRKGAYAEAELHLTEALKISAQLHFLQGEAYALVSLGDLYQDQGKYEQTLKCTEEGFTLAQRLKDHYLITYTSCTLALTYLFMGDPHTAMLLIAEKDQLMPRGEPIYYTQALSILTYGTILLYQSRYEEALSRLTFITKILDDAHLKREQLQAFIRIAVCHLQQKDMPALIRSLEQAAILIGQQGYERVALIELQRMPELLHLIHSQDDLRGIRLLLFPDLEKQDQATSKAELHIPSRSEPLPSAAASTIVTIPLEPEIRIMAFGEPRVFLRGTAITRWRVANAMELCFFLMDQERPVHKEQIFSALWPEKDDALDQALRTAIYYLRKVLGEHAVISRGGFCSLDLNALYNESIWYDVAVFRGYYASAHEALAREDHETAYIAFNSIIEVYHGNYLQPFYSDWCTLRRDELRRMYIDVRHQLALIAWSREQFDESAIHWQNVLAIDSCLEEAHYGLMRCYVRQGKRGLALRQYQRCVAVLQEELAVIPGSSIQGLYDRLTKKA